MNVYKNNQITSTKCQYQMAHSKFILCVFEKWIFDKKIDPINTCKPWNPVAIKKIEP